MSNLIKKRYWAFVCYPESVPSDWLDILKLSGLPISISPLHDRDIDPNGEPKKPHWHVLVCYNAPTTPKNASNFAKQVNGTISIPLESVRGMWRYFCHLDNPDKFQYDHSERINLNGFDISTFVELSKSEVNELKKSIILDILSADICEYSALVDFYIDNGVLDKLDVVMSNTLFFKSYLDSRRWRLSSDTFI